MNHLSFTQLSADDNISQLDVSFALHASLADDDTQVILLSLSLPFGRSRIEDDGVPRDFILMIEMDRSEPLLSAALL